MKKASVLALCLILILLPGCMRSVQLNERAIVQAVGLDKKEDGYALTLQLFDPGGSEKGDTSGGKMLRTEGKTISEAVRAASMQQGQEIFFGHAKLLILGRQIAREGVASVMAYLDGDTRSRPNTDVLIADGKAGEVLSSPLDSTILPVLNTKMMLEGYQDNGRLVRTQLRGLVGSLENPSVGVYLPMAQLGGDEKNPSIQITGTAVLQDGVLAGSLSPEETRGILWAAGEMGKTQLTLEDERWGAVTLQVVDSGAKVTAGIRDGVPFYEVAVHVKSNVGEELFWDESVSSAQRRLRYEEAQSQLVQQETELVLEKLFHGLSCDALGYANFLSQQQPEYWKEYEEEYRDLIPRIGFSVTVDSQVHGGSGS